MYKIEGEDFNDVQQISLDAKQTYVIENINYLTKKDRVVIGSYIKNNINKHDISYNIDGIRIRLSLINESLLNNIFLNVYNALHNE
jgi:hypothetical protein